MGSVISPKRFLFRVSFTLFEIIIAVAVFGFIGASLMGVTESVQRSFDTGVTYSQFSASAREGSNEIATALRAAQSLVYPNSTTPVGDYLVYTFKLNATTTAWAKFCREGRNLVVYNCNNSSPYAEITAAPAFPKQTVGINLESCTFQQIRTGLLGYSLNFYIDADSNTSLLTLSSEVQIRVLQ